MKKKALIKIQESPEIAVYIEGGVCQDVLIVDKEKPVEQWVSANYTLIDFDIEGVDETCKGCRYSPDEHNQH